MRGAEERVSGCKTSEDLNLYQVDVVCTTVFLHTNVLYFLQTKFKAAKRIFLLLWFLAPPQDKSGMTMTSSCGKNLSLTALSLIVYKRSRQHIFIFSF